MNITVTLSDAESQALSLVVSDVDEWVENAAHARAATALSEFRASEHYRDALIAAVGAGVDISDDGAVIAHALDTGIIETAAARQARLDAEREPHQA
jgi:hypothetical protein